MTTWRLIGPFPNDGMAGLQERYAPEQVGVSDDLAEGRHGPVRWRDVLTGSETGYLDLAESCALRTTWSPIWPST